MHHHQLSFSGPFLWIPFLSILWILLSIYEGRVYGYPSVYHCDEILATEFNSSFIIGIHFCSVLASLSRECVIFRLYLNDNKSHQVSWTYLIILAVLNKGVIWMIPIFPFISSSFSFLFKPPGTVSNELILIGLCFTFVFQDFSAL